MKKLKVSFKGGIVRTFDLERIDIQPALPGGRSPSMMHLIKRGDKGYMLHVTSDILPDTEFLDKMEIIEEE